MSLVPDGASDSDVGPSRFNQGPHSFTRGVWHHDRYGNTQLASSPGDGVPSVPPAATHQAFGAARHSALSRQSHPSKLEGCGRLCRLKLQPDG